MFVYTAVKLIRNTMAIFRIHRGKNDYNHLGYDRIHRCKTNFEHIGYVSYSPR